jgi:hypothetical protein
MPKIKQILHTKNAGDHAQVFVLLDDGTEAICYVGGSVQVWFDEKYNKIKAFVMKSS